MRQTTATDVTRRPFLRPAALPFRTVFAAMLAAVYTSACAWGHANQSEENRRPDDRNAESAVTRAKPGADDGERPGPATPARPESRDEPIDCTVETFAVHYYDEDERVTKQISCEDREVLGVQRAALGAEQRRVAREAGLPGETWYLLVDPEGAHPDVLDRRELLEISREFDVQFIGRDAERGLLIYEYQGDL